MFALREKCRSRRVGRFYRQRAFLPDGCWRGEAATRVGAGPVDVVATRVAAAAIRRRRERIPRLFTDLAIAGKDDPANRIHPGQGEGSNRSSHHHGMACQDAGTHHDRKRAGYRDQGGQVLSGTAAIDAREGQISTTPYLLSGTTGWLVPLTCQGSLYLSYNLDPRGIFASPPTTSHVHAAGAGGHGPRPSSLSEKNP